jgi:ATP-dependent DNA helicase RecQ
VDEAHCVSEWGHGFRPDYLRVAQVAGELKVRCVLALTATATREVAADIAGRFGMGADAVVRTGFERGNLRYVVSFCEADERLEVLLSRLRQQEGAVIVYVQRQETAEAVGTFLRRAGLGVRVYHAGLPLEVRTEAQEGFMRGDFPVMVATVAFGMGVDKADVRAVFHYNLPRSIESYLQESGRAGRDGEAALCEVLACAEDEVLLGNLVRGGMIPAGVLRQAVHHLLRRGRRFDVSKYDLGVALDLWPVEIETILACLEQEGFLRCVGERYDAYQWRALVGEERLLAGWEAGRQDFLRRLLKLGERSWRGVRLDVNEAAEKLGVDEDEVVQALQDLAEGGEIRLKGMGARVCYELCAAGDDVRPSEVAERVVERFGRRQEGEIRRLEAVMGYVGQAGCLQQWLLGYLGESGGRECGRCGVCTGEGRGGVEWVSGTVLELTLEAVACMRELQKEGHPALKSPWQQARFLCGLRSFAAQRAKLGGHPLFGRLKGYLFEEVLAHLVV